jgi:DNA-binding winged helix-turn-helix (wHTH) protein
MDKRFLVWALIDQQSQTWMLIGEEDEWSNATALAISCMNRSNIIDVMINEFIPLTLVDGRKIDFRTQTGMDDESNQHQSGVFLNKKSGMVLVDGNTKNLSPLEYELLVLLYERENELIPKSDITRELWDEEYVPSPKNDGRIEQLVSRLRLKIESDPSSPKFITNIPRRGYLFNSGRND